MKSSIFYLIFLFNSLLISAQGHCGFEAWQLEYFTSSKIKESLDFLKSQNWGITNSYQYEKDGVFKFKKWFGNENGRIFYYNSENIKLILMRIPAECWANLKKDLKGSTSQNIFFGDTSSTVKVKNPDSNEYGYVEFHTSDNNSVFNIIIYNQDIISIMNNITGYREALNTASDDLFVSNYEKAKSAINKSLEYLTELSQFSYFNDLQNSEIVNDFYNKDSSFSLPKFDKKVELIETKLDVNSLYNDNIELIKKLDKYIDYKKSDDYDNNISFLEFDEISKHKDILEIQNQIQTLLNSNTPLVWTLNNNPREFDKCEEQNYNCYNRSRLYPNVYEEKSGELIPKTIVSNNIRLTVGEFRVYENTVYVYFNNPNSYDQPVIASVAKAIYNNSISFKVID